MAIVKNFGRARWGESIEIRRWARLQIMVSDLGRGIVAEERPLHAIMESYYQIAKEEVQLMILFFDHYSCGFIS